ncbi:MAG: hypothetical protein WCT50_04240 [Patescibacteria group bacterium]
MKRKDLEKVVQATKDLNMEEIPDFWFDFLKDGWRVVGASCNCGAYWAWLKPSPSGSMKMFGCICCKRIDASKLMEYKRDNSGFTTHHLLPLAQPHRKDIGKIFYSHPDLKGGEIVSREDFAKLNPTDVGFWIEIEEFDV